MWWIVGWLVRWSVIGVILFRVLERQDRKRRDRERMTPGWMAKHRSTR